MTTTSNGEPTLGEIRRRLERLEREIVPRPLYDERQKFIDTELEDQKKWQESHEDSHKWLARLLAGTALSMLVTLIILLINVIGGP